MTFPNRLWDLFIYTAVSTIGEKLSQKKQKKNKTKQTNKKRNMEELVETEDRDPQNYNAYLEVWIISLVPDSF